jgi:hypothetical protein
VFLLDTILRAVRGKIPDPNPTSGKLLLNIWKKNRCKGLQQKNRTKKNKNINIERNLKKTVTKTTWFVMSEKRNKPT